MPLAASYSASKGGMEMLTKTLALEVADKGIIANLQNLDDDRKLPWFRV
jgi:NAD(P)-dependent dehydrogenase (short-subunit alcohol dehydrogenase family)